MPNDFTIIKASFLSLYSSILLFLFLKIWCLGSWLHKIICWRWQSAEEVCNGISGKKVEMEECETSWKQIRRWFDDSGPSTVSCRGGVSGKIYKKYNIIFQFPTNSFPFSHLMFLFSSGFLLGFFRFFFTKTLSPFCFVYLD